MPATKSASTMSVQIHQDTIPVTEPRKPYVAPVIANPFTRFMGVKPSEGWNSDVLLYKLGRVMGEMHLRENGNKPHPGEMTYEYSTAEVRKVVFGLSQALAEAILLKYGG